MPDHKTRTITGQISHVFGHRFVIETKSGAILADVTPHGRDAVTLAIGDTVELTGEMKPTELKVSRFVRNGKTIEIAHKNKHHDARHKDQGEADPKVALHAAKEAGYHPLGEPRRKPKHFEVLGRREGELTELHIELDGHIRKSKPADKHDLKWSEALSA